MRSKELQSLREKSVDELRALVIEEYENLFKLRARRVYGELRSSSDLAERRRSIARAKTILRERELGIGEESE